MTTDDPGARLEFLESVLRIFDPARPYGDLSESILMLSRGGQTTFIVNANDLFAWATADGVEITPENLPMLWQALADVRIALKAPPHEPSASVSVWHAWYDAGSYAAALFCCRVRRQPPQAAYLDTLPSALRPLFAIGEDA